MIKLRDLIKDFKVNLGKVYTDKDRPPFKTDKQIKLETKISVKGSKYLDLGGGDITSLPGPYDRDAVVFRNNRGDTLVYRDSKGIYADINNRSDERFKDLKQLVNWLNKNNYRYVGIDDR